VVIVEAAADGFEIRQQHVILHIDDARGVVGALQERAEPHEPVGVVAEHRVRHGAAEELRTLFHPVEQLADVLGREVVFPETAHVEPGRIDRVPHVDGECRPDRARVAPRRFDAGQDRGRIVGVARQMVDHGGSGRILVLGVEAFVAAQRHQRRMPFAGIGAGLHRQARHAHADVEQACRVLDPLHVAGQPVQAVGGAAKHAATRR
jgi:hypothetical protein